MQPLNLTKDYQCICGKTFTNSQSFNGHKSHCKIHRIAKGGEDDYNAYLAKQAKASTAAQRVHKEISKVKRDTDLAIWLSAKPTCERCGMLMTEKFGSGRFCSRACANSRDHSEQSKQKIRDSLNTTLVSRQKAPVRAKKACIICGVSIKSCNKTGLCRNCLEHTSEGLAIKQELGKRGYATKQERGTHVGWQSRNITSYAEQFWMQVLDNNEISYSREVPVKRGKSNYFLDFVIEHNGKLIDLEIDGKQHLYEDRIASDVARDLYLTKLGYLVYRVTWNEISSESGSNEMKDKIDAFLAFYHDIK
jgi:very-short-patch-repair endonuclease/ribosomal protein S14